MANKYLDKTGLQQVWSKVLEKDGETLQAAKNYADSNKTSTESTLNANIQAVNKTVTDFIGTKGIANGLAPLDSTGKVPTANLPSYVDDVLEFATRTSFPSAGETGKIYVAQDTNMTYRWTGTTYAQIKGDLTLGETSSTAYAGDKGKANADAISTLTTNLGNLTKDVEDNYLKSADASSTYQTKLVSGESIKTINSTSLLGNGNIAVQPTLVSGSNIKTVNNTSLLGEGNIAVQPTLVSGTNIKTINSKSILGSGNIDIADEMSSSFYNKPEIDGFLANMVEWSAKPETNTQSVVTSLNGKVTASPHQISSSLENDSNVPTAEGVKLYLRTNLATVNGQSLLNGGNIAIEVDNLDMSGYYTKDEADSAFIKLTGNQTISGIKTFNNPVEVKEIYFSEIIESAEYHGDSIVLNSNEGEIFVIALPEKEGVLALTSDLATALTTADINEVCV